MHGSQEEYIGTLLSMLPRRISAAIESIGVIESVEEIRLRVSKRPQVITANGDAIVDTLAFTRAEACELLERMCGHSVYAWAEELRHGFMTLEGGSRVGMCGKPVVECGRVVRMTDVTCFNIRIAREIIGCAESIIKNLSDCGIPVSTLIISPPGGGKTTLLRDIARCLSDGIATERALKIAIADERNELSGCVDGIPSFDVGTRTDIMESVPKAESIMMLVRCMSPDVIITDEIGSPSDAQAIQEASRSGVAVIASAHAEDMEDLHSRKVLSDMIKNGAFKRVLLLRRRGRHMELTPVSI